MAKLPSVTSQIPRDLKLFVDRVREALSSGSLVTKEQLESGEVVPAKSKASDNSSGQQGVDPNTGCVVVTTPPAPQGLTAEGGYRAVIVTWDPALYCGHAHTELWAAEVDDLDEAVKIGIAPGQVYVHNIGSNETRFYWAYNVTINGTRGAVVSQDGVQASSGVDVEYLLGELDEQIAESSLVQGLNERIDLVDADETVEGSVAQQILGVNQAIQVEAETRGEQTGELYSQYTVKIDQDGRVSGYGLASTLPEGEDGEPFSEFAVSADRFTVGAPNLDNVQPFTVLTSPELINGETVPAGVYIDTAYIADGTITSAKIGDATIDTAKIAGLEAGKIRSGVIESGVVMQSADFNEQLNSGWRIESAGQSSGNAVFNNATIRGTVYAVDGEFTGDLRNSNSTSYGSGTGLWSGNNENGYRFRVGDPRGAQLKWTGQTVDITRSDGSTLFSSGEFMESRDGKMRIDFFNKYIYMEL